MRISFKTAIYYVRSVRNFDCFCKCNSFYSAVKLQYLPISVSKHTFFGTFLCVALFHCVSFTRTASPGRRRPRFLAVPKPDSGPSSACCAAVIPWSPLWPCSFHFITRFNVALFDLRLLLSERREGDNVPVSGTYFDSPTTSCRTCSPASPTHLQW